MRYPDKIYTREKYIANFFFGLTSGCGMLQIAYIRYLGSPFVGMTIIRNCFWDPLGPSFLSVFSPCAMTHSCMASIKMLVLSLLPIPPHWRIRVISFVCLVIIFNRIIGDNPDNLCLVIFDRIIGDSPDNPAWQCCSWAALFFVASTAFWMSSAFRISCVASTKLTWPAVVHRLSPSWQNFSKSWEFSTLPWRLLMASSSMLSQRDFSMACFMMALLKSYWSRLCTFVFGLFARTLETRIIIRFSRSASSDYTSSELKPNLSGSTRLSSILRDSK